MTQMRAKILIEEFDVHQKLTHGTRKTAKYLGKLELEIN